MKRGRDNTVSTFILHSPAEFARSAGVDADAILRRHGIAPDTLKTFGMRAPAIEAMAAWADLAAESRDPNFGLDLATREAVGTYDVLGYIVRSSPDLDHGVAQFVRYQRLLGDAWRIEFRKAHDVAVFTHEFLVPVRQPRHMVEHSLAMVVLRAREFTGGDWHPLEVTFRHAAPASVALYDRVFGCPVRFEQLKNAIRFDPTSLAWPLRATDQRLAAVLERYATDAIDRMPRPGDFASRVRGAIVELLKEGDCSAALVARQLHTSPRTLQRHLAAQGTSLRELIDAVRRELAEAYLAKPWMTMEEIAMLLGFADASGFTHAFRRWTGRAPVEYRRARAGTTRVER